MKTVKVIGGLLALAGLALLGGGGWLVALQGSWYYVIAGLLLLAVGVMLVRRDPRALGLFAALLIGTAAWAYAEVGLDVWLLMPRLLTWIVIGLLLCLPIVWRRLTRSGTPAPSTESRSAAVVLGIAVALTVALGAAASLQDHSTHGTWSGTVDATAAADSSVADADWRFYGRTPRGDRFSPLADITPANVGQLREAWVARTGDTMRPGENKGGTDAGHEFNFEATPLKVGDTLYVCTPHSWVVALDAQTGRQKWRFDPKAETKADVYLACRGVAYYEVPAGTSTPCPRRIISPVLDARLLAVNADTGIPCEDFGDHGFVSLTQYLGHVGAGFHFVTSPPLVLADRVILGGWIRDNVARNEPSGAVRAFDPITGKIVWAWDVGHPDAPVVHPGATDELTRSTPNAWGAYTADPDLGLVYLPLGNATPDYFGTGRRPFDDAYSSSIVALDIETGAPRWHFQTTHHDVWDMDLPIGPSLVDLPSDDTNVPALVQTTKRGELFMLDRRTGVPIAAVTEKPVPQDAVPGEHLAATQPFSTGMPSLAPPDITEVQMWGATPFDQLACRIDFRRSHYEGQFTPPGTQTTIVYPAFDGVIDWHGAAIDPARKLLVANTSYIPFLIKLTPTQDALAKGWIKPWNGQGTPPDAVKDDVAPQYGTPYVGQVHPWLNFLGVPCKAPPWGQLTAIDLVTRKIVWQHDLGTTRDTGPLNTHFNLPLPTGIFNIGGNITTRSGLVFIGATADDYLRAFDITNGRELWRARLPAGGQATPMSYRAADGRQYVVIAAGGHGGLGTRSGDYVVSYALPR
jgi:quinoprotein glucose dehydrogenase